MRREAPPGRRMPRAPSRTKDCAGGSEVRGQDLLIRNLHSVLSCDGPDWLAQVADRRVASGRQPLAALVGTRLSILSGSQNCTVWPKAAAIRPGAIDASCVKQPATTLRRSRSSFFTTWRSTAPRRRAFALSCQRADHVDHQRVCGVPSRAASRALAARSSEVGSAVPSAEHRLSRVSQRHVNHTNLRTRLGSNAR